MLNQDIPEEFYDHVETIAWQVQRKWPDLEWEDIRQDMWVFLLENQGELSLMQEDGLDELYMKLRKIAHQTAQARTNSDRMASGQYRYATRHIRTMLEAGFLLDDTLGTLSEQLDFTTALAKLQETNPNYHRFILERYNFGLHNEAGARVTVQRAVDKLTRYMNQSRLGSIVRVELDDRNDNYEMNIDQILSRIDNERGNTYAASR